MSSKTSRFKAERMKVPFEQSFEKNSLQGQVLRGLLSGLASNLDWVSSLYDAPVGVYDYVSESDEDNTARYFEKKAEKLYDELTNNRYVPNQAEKFARKMHDRSNVVAGVFSPGKKAKKIGEGVGKLGGKALKYLNSLPINSNITRGASALAGYEAQQLAAENIDQNSVEGRLLTALTPLLTPHVANTAKKSVSNVVKNSLLKKLDPELVELYKKGNLNAPITALLDASDPKARKMQGFYNNIIQQGGGEKSRIGIEKFLDDISKQITGKDRKLPKNEDAMASIVLEESVKGLNEKWKKPKETKEKVIEGVKALNPDQRFANAEHGKIIASINEKFPNNEFNLLETYSNLPEKKRAAFIKNISENFGLNSEASPAQSPATSHKNDLIIPSSTKNVVEQLSRASSDNAILSDFKRALEKFEGKIPIDRLDEFAKNVNMAINDNTKQPLFSKKSKLAISEALEQDMARNLSEKQKHLPSDSDYATLWKESKNEMAKLLSDYPYERQAELKRTALGLDDSAKNKFVADEYFSTKKNEKGENILNDLQHKPLTELASPESRQNWINEYMHSLGYGNEAQSFTPNKFFNRYAGLQEPMQKKLAASHADSNNSKLNLNELNKVNESMKGSIKEGQNTSGTAAAAEKNKLMRSVAKLFTNPGSALSDIGANAAKRLLAETVLYDEKGLESLLKKPKAKDYLPTSDDVIQFIHTARNPGTKFINNKEGDEEKNYVSLADQL